MKKIRVLIVDDSIFFREFMSRSLSNYQDIEIIGMASDAFEAQQKTMSLLPDVITLDMEMPKMRGTDFLRYLRPRYPQIQVIVISSNPNNIFESLQAGAMDFVSKPSAQLNIDNNTFIREVVNKIHIAAKASSKPVPQPIAQAAPARPIAPPLPLTLNVKNPKSIIAIGASTGGTEAILEVLKNLPKNTPGIVIVQHMPPVFTKMYAERLDKVCKISVREAKDGDRVETGLALIAEGSQHMRVKSDGRGYFVKCEAGEKISGHCPSVDALFESVAKAAGANAVGVILTGMGADGAKNLLAMKKTGAHTIGQDQATCVVYGMPMVAYNLGGVCEQLPLTSISAAVLRYLSK